MTGRMHDLAAFTALSLTIIYLSLHKVTLATGIVAIAANIVGGIMEKFILFPALIIFNGYLYFSNYTKIFSLFKNLNQ